MDLKYSQLPKVVLLHFKLEMVSCSFSFLASYWSIWESRRVRSLLINFKAPETEYKFARRYAAPSHLAAWEDQRAVYSRWKCMLIHMQAENLWPASTLCCSPWGKPPLSANIQILSCNDPWWLCGRECIPHLAISGKPFRIYHSTTGCSSPTGDGHYFMKH